jgi:hypothetical protein
MRAASIALVAVLALAALAHAAQQDEVVPAPEALEVAFSKGRLAAKTPKPVLTPAQQQAAEESLDAEHSPAAPAAAAAPLHALLAFAGLVATLLSLFV